MFLFVRFVLHLEAHRKTRAFLASECARHVVARAWHLQAVLGFACAQLAAKAISRRLTLHLGRVNRVKARSRLGLALLVAIQGSSLSRAKLHRRYAVLFLVVVAARPRLEVPLLELKVFEFASHSE